MILPPGFYPHFSCVRARYLIFYDFLNNAKRNLVKKKDCQKDRFCGHRARAQNGQKTVSIDYIADNEMIKRV